MYATGGGVTKDDAKAAEWYGKSLSRGIPTFITIWA
jgi:TPR repeat protein